MKEKLCIKKCIQTCYACPSQWDLFTEDDQYIYMRYRWGHFYAEKDKEIIFEYDADNRFDGLMETETMIKLLSNLFDFSKAQFESMR
jgi:hypothetical protein